MSQRSFIPLSGALNYERADKDEKLFVFSLYRKRETYKRHSQERRLLARLLRHWRRVSPRLGDEDI